MSESKTGPLENQGVNSSCDPSLTRKEFIHRVVKGVAITGGVLATSRILDKFLVLPAFASFSSCGLSVGATTNSPGADTVELVGSYYEISCTGSDIANRSLCVSGLDKTGQTC